MPSVSNAGSTGRTEALHDRVAHLERRLDILHQIQREVLNDDRTVRSFRTLMTTIRRIVESPFLRGARRG